MLELCLCQLFSKILVPLSDDPSDLRERLEHFLRGIYERNAFVRGALPSFNVAVLFQMREMARDAAFVDADVSGKLFLRNSGMAANGKDIACLLYTSDAADE